MEKTVNNIKKIDFLIYIYEYYYINKAITCILLSSNFRSTLKYYIKMTYYIKTDVTTSSTNIHKASFSSKKDSPETVISFQINLTKDIGPLFTEGTLQLKSYKLTRVNASNIVGYLYFLSNKTLNECESIAKNIILALDERVTSLTSTPSVSSSIKTGCAMLEKLPQPSKYASDAKDFPNFSGGSTKPKKNFAAVAAFGTPSVSMPKLITTSEDIAAEMFNIRHSISKHQNAVAEMLNTIEDEEGRIKALTKLFEETKAEEERKAKDAELKAKETKAKEAEDKKKRLIQLETEMALLKSELNSADESEIAEAVATTTNSVVTISKSIATTPEPDTKPESKPESKLKVPKIKVKTPKLVAMKSSSAEKTPSFESIGEKPIEENLDEKGYGRYSPSSKTLNFDEDD